MEPRGELSSTGYALASPGHEYLILQPGEPAEPFTVSLEPGTYSVEWHDLATRATEADDTLTLGDHAKASFTAPSAGSGPAILYLKKLSS